MRTYKGALIAALAGLAVLSGAQTIHDQAAQARDFAAKAYLTNNPRAKMLPNRVLVRFANTAKASEKASARASAKGLLIRKYKIVSGLELIDTPLGTEKAIEILRKSPHVISVEPDRVAHINVIPNDTNFGVLWGMNQASNIDINAPEAWNVFTGDPNFLVADFDTGIDYSHADLSANVWTNPGETPGNGLDDDGNGYVDDVHGFDFVNNDGDPADDHGHGTHTAGTIGARGNNALGVAGVNWACKILSIKVFNAAGNGSDADIIAGMDYLAQSGAKLSNHSWGDVGQQDGSTWTALYAACQTLESMGHLMVCSAGNSAHNNDLVDGAANIPASFNLSNIISVAAIDSAGAKASFSSYGVTTCDLAGPGVNVYSSIPGGAYTYLNGTSMAAPHVTGGAALLWAYHPNLTITEIKNRILGNTKAVPAMSGLCVTGGMLNLAPIIVNAFPDADAGADQNIEATGSSTSFTLDASGSSDPERDALSYQWLENAVPVGSGSSITLSRGVGSYTFKVVVTDARGGFETDAVTVNILDTSKPAFGAISDVNASATSTSGAVVTFASPIANDLVDGQIPGICSPSSGSTFAPGTTLVSVTATDTDGNSASSSFNVNVTYAWSGFQSPSNNQQIKKNAVVPIRFQLSGASANISNLQATASWATVKNGIIGPETPIGTFAYSSTAHSYNLNWPTKGRAKGTYRIKAVFGDGVARTVNVLLK